MTGHGVGDGTIKGILSKKPGSYVGRDGEEHTFDRYKVADDGKWARFVIVWKCDGVKYHPDAEGGHLEVSCITGRSAVMEHVARLDSGTEIELVGDFEVKLKRSGWPEMSFRADAVAAWAVEPEPEPSPVVSENDDGLPF